VCEVQTERTVLVVIVVVVVVVVVVIVIVIVVFVWRANGNNFLISVAISSI
jgi:hypothetical protein